MAGSDYIVVQQPGDECEGGLQTFGSQAIDVEQGRPSIRVHTVLHLLDGDGLSPEVCDAFSSSVRGKLGVHEAGYQRDILLGICHLTNTSVKQLRISDDKLWLRQH